ncbi:MAG: LVIVD repeat-containing protein [Candidatus Heimdallarchaeota archaeon]
MNVQGATVTITLEKVSEIATGGAPFDVQFVDDCALVSDYFGGLSVFNISDETNPTVVDNLPLTLPHYFHIYNELAFVACWNAGLQIVNLTDLNNLTIIGSYNDGVEMGGTYASNCIALATKTNGGTIILNVTNPTQPKKIYQYNTTGIPNICKIRENIAFIAYWEASGSRIVFLNITNTASPEFIGEYETGNTYDFLLEEDLLVIGNDNTGVHFVNITDLTNPTLLNQIDTRGSVLGIDTLDNYVFVSDSYTIEVIDYMDIDNLQIIGSYDNNGESQKLEVIGDLVYCCNAPLGLVIYQYTIVTQTAGLNLNIIAIIEGLIVTFGIIKFRKK